jgi:hypothetical protein
LAVPPAPVCGPSAHLNPAERVVADYILENPETVLYCSISKLSANTGTRDATVIVLCRNGLISGAENQPSRGGNFPD